MSRIGNKPINIPASINVKIIKNILEVSGKKELMLSSFTIILKSVKRQRLDIYKIDDSAVSSLCMAL